MEASTNVHKQGCVHKERSTSNRRQAANTPPFVYVCSPEMCVSTETRNRHNPQSTSSGICVCTRRELLYTVGDRPAQRVNKGGTIEGTKSFISFLPLTLLTTLLRTLWPQAKISPQGLSQPPSSTCLKSASLATVARFSGCFWHCNVRAFPILFDSFRILMTRDQVSFFPAKSDAFPTINIPILALDKATQILLLVLRNPMMPCLLERTSDNKMISFSSP